MKTIRNEVFTKLLMIKSLFEQIKVALNTETEFTLRALVVGCFIF